MRIATGFELRRRALSAALIAPVIFLSGCGKIDNRSALTAINETAPQFSTPEQTIEAFIQALEAEDPILAADFFVASERAMYEPTLKQLDLKALAKDYRDFPPIQISVSDRVATFLITSTATGKPMQEELSLVLDGGKWWLQSL